MTKFAKQRQRYIGGTDVAGILGVSDYKSPLQVWNDKVNGSDFTGNYHTEFGVQMEKPVADWFKKKFQKEHGCKIKIEKVERMTHEKHPEFVANLDRVMMITSQEPVTVDGYTINPNQPVIIEIKTAGDNQWKEWTDDKLPNDHYCQVQHYYNVSGHQHAIIVAMVGKRLVWKYIPRNDEAIAEWTLQLLNFWNTFVVSKIQPYPDGGDGDKKLIHGWYSDVDDKTTEVKIPNEVLESYQALKEKEARLKEELSSTERNRKSIEQKIMLDMGESGVAQIGDAWIAQRKEIVRKECFLKESRYIRFDLKKIRGKKWQQ